VRFVAAAVHPSRFPRGGQSEVAFVGRSNVGKSSLINSLLGDARAARVSGTPGRTQVVHFHLVNEAFFFVDLPGYGFARAPAQVRERFADLIESYLAGREALVLAVLLTDGRHPPMASDLGMAAWLGAKGIPFAVVLTKIDKLPRGSWERAREEASRAFEAPDVLVHSSKTGEGRKGLWQIIERRIGVGRTTR